MDYRMTTSEMKEFILGVCDGKILTSEHLPSADLIPKVFMVLSFLDESQTEGLENVGCIWEWTSKSTNLAINGYPTFNSCNIMHKKDWKICATAINKELKRRKDLQLDIQQELDLEDNNASGDSGPS